MTDPIGDMIIRIKNGYQARKEKVTVPYSKMKENLAEIMVKTGYLKKVEVLKEKKIKTLVLTLKYRGKMAAVTGVKRISKPGLRIYRRSDKIKKLSLGYGINIVSTPAGLMTGKKAAKNNLGGEVICEIW